MPVRALLKACRHIAVATRKGRSGVAITERVLSDRFSFFIGPFRSMQSWHVYFA
jgi:hypothetical protein